MIICCRALVVAVTIRNNTNKYKMRDRVLYVILYVLVCSFIIRRTTPINDHIYNDVRHCTCRTRQKVCITPVTHFSEHVFISSFNFFFLHVLIYVYIYITLSKTICDLRNGQNPKTCFKHGVLCVNNVLF